jgi:hypothetical protein
MLIWDVVGCYCGGKFYLTSVFVLKIWYNIIVITERKGVAYEEGSFADNECHVSANLCW